MVETRQKGIEKYRLWRRRGEVREADIARHGEWTVSVRPGIAVTDITGGLIPFRKMEDEKDAYVKNAKAKATVLTAKRDGSTDTDYFLVGPSITAAETMAMLYHAAPSKMYGIDPADILGYSDTEEGDWASIFRDDNRALRKGHERIPGWGKTIEEIPRIYDFLKRNYTYKGSGIEQFNAQDPNDHIVPVVHFRKTADGDISIVLDQPDEEVREMLSAALPEQIADTDKISSGMGLMYATAYSPENTRWPRQLDNNLQENNGQSMTSTQVLGLAYYKITEAQNGKEVPPKENLQKSKLLHAFADYADTGVVRRTRIQGVTEEGFANDVSVRTERKQRVQKKISEAVITVGALTMANSLAQDFSDTRQQSLIGASYEAMAPSYIEAERATGSLFVLEELSQQHPELIDIFHAKKVENHKVVLDYNAKVTEWNSELEPYDKKRHGNIGWGLAGLVLFAAGINGKYRDRKK